MAETVGSLRIELGVDSRKFSSGLNKANRSTERFANKTQKSAKKAKAAFGGLLKSIGPLGAALTGLATGGLFLLVKRAAEAADVTGKFAKAIGTTTEQLTRLQFAASQTAGTTNEELNKALEKMSKNLADAAAGTGVFGLLISESSASMLLAIKDPIEQFKVLADVISGVENPAVRVKLAMDLFGRAGGKLVNTFKEGSEGIEKLFREADKLGLVLSTEVAEKAAKANDAMDKLSRTFTNQKTIIFADLFPAIIAIANGLLTAMAAAKDFFAFLSGSDEFAELSNELVDVKLRLKEVAELREFLGRAGAPGTLGAVIPALAPQADLFRELNDLTERQLELQERLAEITRERLGQGAAQVDAASLVPSKEDIARIIGELETEFAGGDAAGGTKRTLTSAIFGSVDANELAFAVLLEAIVAAHDAQNLTQDEFFAKIEEAARQHQDRMTKIETIGGKKRTEFEEANLQGKTKMIIGQLVATTSAVAQHNKALFVLNKAAAIANAVVFTAEGVARAFKDFPVPIAIGMAAIVAAAGAAQIAAIASTSFAGGGRGTTPSAAAAGAVVNDFPVNRASPFDAISEERQNAPASGITIVVQGDINANNIEELVDEMGRLINEQDAIPIRRDSRQAEILVGTPG